MVDVYHRLEIYRKIQKGTGRFYREYSSISPFGNMIDEYLII